MQKLSEAEKFNFLIRASFAACHEAKSLLKHDDSLYHEFSIQDTAV